MNKEVFSPENSTRDLDFSDANSTVLEPHPLNTKTSKGVEALKQNVVLTQDTFHAIHTNFQEIIRSIEENKFILIQQERELADNRQKIRGTRGQLSKLLDEHKKLESIHIGLKKKHGEDLTSIKKLEEEYGNLEELQIKIKKLENHIRVLVEKDRKHQEQNKKIQEENSKLALQLDQLLIQMDTVSRSNKKVIDSITLEKDQLSRSHYLQLEEIRTLKKSLSQESQKVVLYSEKIKNLHGLAQQKIDLLKQRYNGYVSQKMSEKETEFAQMEKKWESVQKELSNAKNVAAEQKSKLVLVANKAISLHQRVQSQQQDLQKVQSQLTYRESERKRFEIENSELIRSSRELKSQVSNLRDRFTRTRENYLAHGNSLVELFTELQRVWTEYPEGIYPGGLNLTPIESADEISKRFVEFRNVNLNVAAKAKERLAVLITDRQCLEDRIRNIEGAHNELESKYRQECERATRVEMDLKGALEEVENKSRNLGSSYEALQNDLSVKLRSLKSFEIMHSQVVREFEQFKGEKTAQELKTKKLVEDLCRDKKLLLDQIRQLSTDNKIAQQQAKVEIDELRGAQIRALEVVESEKSRLAKAMAGLQESHQVQIQELVSKQEELVVEHKERLRLVVESRNAIVEQMNRLKSEYEDRLKSLESARLITEAGLRSTISDLQGEKAELKQELRQQDAHYKERLELLTKQRLEVESEHAKILFTLEQEKASLAQEIEDLSITYQNQKQEQSDHLTEVQRQHSLAVSALKEQNVKLALDSDHRFHRQQDRIKTLNEEWTTKTSSLQGEVEQLTLDKTELQKEVKELQKQGELAMQSLETERAEREQDRNRSRQDAMAVSERHQEIVSQAEGTIAELRTEKSEVKSKLERVLERNRQRVGNLVRITKEQKRVNDELRSIMDQLRVEKTQETKQVETLRLELTAMKIELSSTSRALQKQIDQYNDLKLHVDSNQKHGSTVLKTREKQLNYYSRSINSEKSSLRDEIMLLVDELKTASTLNPLRNYLTITEREISKVEIDLSKIPLVASDRPRMEDILTQLIRQRDAIRDMIQESEGQYHKKIRKLLSVAHSEALSPIPPLPPEDRSLDS
jgi:hypothetical protein